MTVTSVTGGRLKNGGGVWGVNLSILPFKIEESRDNIESKGDPIVEVSEFVDNSVEELMNCDEIYPQV